MSTQPLEISRVRNNPEVGDPINVAVSGTVAIETHGCKLNQADSAVIARQFAQAGYQLVDHNGDADIIVVNTCTVTATADSKARQALRAAHRSNPGAIVVAAGCYPQRAADELRRMPEVSIVVGNEDKASLAQMAIAELTQRQNRPTRNMGRVETTGGILRRSRAMVKIQEGCDQVCAYCIVPKVRGRERSIPPENLVSTIRQHVDLGFKEVALTGTQLGTYGFDLDQTDLVGLLVRILRESEVPRLRVSSLQAHEISPHLLDLWQDSRLCPHFHVPLQSGCDTTLKAMRRRYDTDTFRRAVDLIRERVPNASITTDIIVGFPGEDNRAHETSAAFAAEMRFSDIHIFPYSQRPGTTAHYLPDQVASDEKRRRAAEMQDVAREAFTAYRQRILGETRTVLWETARSCPNTEMLRWSGLTDNYVRVHALTDRDLSNSITGAQLVGLEDKSVLTVTAS